MVRTGSTFRLLAVLALAILSASLVAQTPYPIEGYISRIQPPNSYEVGGRLFLLARDTSFGWMGTDSAGSPNPQRGDLRVGAYVQVEGRDLGLSKPILAATVLIRDNWNRKLTGTGVITRVVSPGPNAVFEADGYLVRVGPGTQMKFDGDLDSLADISTNTWLHFSGKGGRDGVVEAAKAEFIPAKPTKFKAAKDFEVATVQARPAGTRDADQTSKEKGTPALTDDGAALKQDEELKIGLGHWHTLPADQPLQQRVHRIGMALVPVYQREMAEDNPSKIHFRFFAVDNKRWRGAVCLLDGAVLVSTQTIERLNNDDQLAAVVADGVACNLQRQAARSVVAMRKDMGITVALDVAEAFVPGVGLAALLVPGGFTGKEQEVMEAERLRMGLALMHDAGFDPWQAPEAWRLALPRKLPADLTKLTYPDTSCFQLEILNAQYVRK